MSDTSETEPTRPPISPADLAAYIRGDATPEQRSAIVVALEDPTSQLHEWLKSTASFAKERLGRVGRNTTPRQDIETAAIHQLDELLAYVLKKRLAGVLTDAEILKIGDRLGLSGDVTQQPSPNDAQATVHRVVKFLGELRPELAGELTELQASRRR